MEHTIDAKHKSIGRVASEAAKFLMGKTSPSYERNKQPGTKVTIVNASRVSVSQKKKEDTIYTTYSGYPGGLKEKSMKAISTKKGMSEIIRLAVKGMLPKNKLTPGMMKKLSITE